MNEFTRTGPGCCERSTWMVPAILVLALTILSQSAYGQVGEGGEASLASDASPLVHQIDIYIGGLLTDDASGLNSGAETGFRYRCRCFDRFSCEYEVGIVFTEDVDEDGLLAHAQFQVLFHLGGPKQRVEPFLLAGAGIVHYNSLGRSEDGALLTAGVGFDFRWRQDRGFRLDFRAVDLDLEITSGAGPDLAVNWATTFSF